MGRLGELRWHKSSYSANGGASCVEVAAQHDDCDYGWRKSSYSANGGASCVEVADRSATVLVRDTTDRGGPTLTFSAAAWRRFMARVTRSTR